MATFAELNLLDCANCTLDAGGEYVNAAEPAKCGHCGKTVQVRLFPALWLRRNPPKDSSGAAVIGAESSCFYHPAKQAAKICDGCGRFLCALCDVEFDGRHLCTSCLQSESNSEVQSKPVARYVYYDTIALTCAFAGMVIAPFFFIFAPAALYFVVRYWRRPLSVIPRSRWRFVLAAIMALVELGGGGWFIVASILGVAS